MTDKLIQTEKKRGKPWKTKEWQERRAELIKDKSCTWCGSKKKLTISHDQRNFNPRMERYRVFSRYFHDYFAMGLLDSLIPPVPTQHLDEYNQLWEQAQAGVKIEYYNVCPNCNTGAVYSRSEKFCKENNVPTFSCTKCHAQFQEAVKKVKRDSLYYTRRNFNGLFWERHNEELKQLITAHMEKLSDDYLNFKGVTVLCARCHCAYHKGFNLCPICKAHYKKENHEMCWECFTKTERGKKVLEDKKPIPYIHPWCEKTFMIQKEYWWIEARPHMCCMNYCENRGDISECEIAKKHWNENDEDEQRGKTHHSRLSDTRQEPDRRSGKAEVRQHSAFPS